MTDFHGSASYSETAPWGQRALTKPVCIEAMAQVSFMLHRLALHRGCSLHNCSLQIWRRVLFDIMHLQCRFFLNCHFFQSTTRRSPTQSGAFPEPIGAGRICEAIQTILHFEGCAAFAPRLANGQLQARSSGRSSIAQPISSHPNSETSHANPRKIGVCSALDQRISANEVTFILPNPRTDRK